MPKLTINGTEIEVPPGTSILQAAELLGYEVPRFCYHDRLSVPANCRMCLVEVKGAPKPVASCAMACGDNMEITTNSGMIQKARKGVMEMLLINHPLDCPICDQGGECDLQDQAVGYGFDRSRYHEDKRATKDKDLGPLVKTVMTRCIHCTRCIRFGEEIAGVPALGLLNRGEDVEIGTFVGKAIESELSGNLVDVCPVGALTSAPYEFKARPWELRKTESIDVHDAVGCNIRIDARGNEVLRIQPRLHEDVNEEWLNDRSRYAYDGLKNSRLDRPYVRDTRTGPLRESTWEEALQRAGHCLSTTPSDKISAFVGPLADVDSMVALKDVMQSLGVTALECRDEGAQFDASHRAGYLFNTTITGLENADAVLLIGTNPKWEATLVNARIRKAWRARKMPVGVIGPQIDLTYPVTHLGATFGDLDKLVKGRSDFITAFKKAERPVMIVGAGVFARPDGLAIHAYLRQLADTLKLVRDGWNGFNILHHAASRVGALDIGFTAAEPLDMSSMECVYLLGSDSPELLAAIPQAATVIYQGHHGDIGAQRADVILPGAAYTEKDALYVNMEGRPQLAKRAVAPPHLAHEDWRIIRAVSDNLDQPLPYVTQAQLRQRLGRDYPHLLQFDVITPAAWGPFGQAGAVEGTAQLLSPVTDFYRTNVITRASATMAACSERFGMSSTALQAAE
ncbi:MAG: NADH-quinone oxidoreductase subunit NuoG [Pseudomonadota bacterium]